MFHIGRYDSSWEALLNNPFIASAILTGPGLKIEFTNKAFTSLAGTEAHSLEGKNGQEVIEKVFNKETAETIGKVYNSGESQYLHEVRPHVNETTDGEPHFFNLLLQPLLENDKSIAGLILLAFDITEEVKGKEDEESDRIEKALKEVRDGSELQSRIHEVITDNTPDLVYAFDLDARFTFANKALLTMWGRTKEDSFGKSLLEIGYEPWHAAMHEREIEQIKKTKETIRGEVSFPHATLGRRVYDYIFVPVLDDEGNVTAIAGTTRDITEIRELLRQKDEFLGIASHELKTPVTSIKAYGQVLQTIFERKQDYTAVAALQKMDAQINKLTGLISDLLDVTKIQAGKIVFNEENFDLSNQISDIVYELQLTTQKHQIIKRLEPGIVVNGDKERISQVVINFITNAIKYSPDADKIEVQLYKNGDKIITSVKDFGIGIAPEVQNHIFEQFYRVSAAHSTIPGLGIGLYISSEIAKRIGGNIWVESKVKEGSTFYFSIPEKKENHK
ncbi:MAG: PAS domain-containing sensor histidine kinase [Ginsengibacter sp.]